MRALYDRTARHYDAASFLYRLTGIEHRRKQLIESMALPKGGTVVDLGTGTGANLKLLSKAVGETGTVIGVDLSPGMLAKARDKIEHLPNVKLVECDSRSFEFPARLDGVISTFSLEFIPEYEAVIKRTTLALSGGAPLALMGLKYPARWPEWMAAAGIWFNRSFGVTKDHKDFKPWIAAEKYCQAAIFKELYAGSSYMWLGSAEHSN
jgi:SAM-dependent methyltransferase